MLVGVGAVASELKKNGYSHGNATACMVCFFFMSFILISPLCESPPYRGGAWWLGLSLWGVSAAAEGGDPMDQSFAIEAGFWGMVRHLCGGEGA